MWCFSTTRAVASPFAKTNEATPGNEIQRFRVNQVRESPRRAAAASRRRGG